MQLADRPCAVQIRTIERVCEIPHEGPFCDLMWSDPEEIDTWAVSPRGAGWLFGGKVCRMSGAATYLFTHMVACTRSAGSLFRAGAAIHGWCQPRSGSHAPFYADHTMKLLLVTGHGGV